MPIIMSLKAGFESQIKRASEICPAANEQISSDSLPGLIVWLHDQFCLKCFEAVGWASNL